MSQGLIHFEVFIRKGKVGGWSLHGAFTQRDHALAEARALIATGAAGGVRVFKETFKEDTGEFMTLKVYEDGHVSDPKVKTNSAVSLPCFKPDDLYSYHGRRTIARLLRDSLTRWGITVTELLHHPGHIERLEMTDTVLQHAIQKAAIRHAGATGDPVQQVVKTLNELVTRATERVVADAGKGRLPRIGKESFGALCLRFVGEPAANYLLNSAIAAHIEGAKSWSDKLNTVVALIDDLPKDDSSVRTLGLDVIDSLVGEMLSGDAALGDLLGTQPDLGTALLKMADVFLGQLDVEAESEPALKALCAEFAKGNLVNARASIAHRVLQEIQGVRRLKPQSPDEEVEVMRRLATRMVMGQGRLVTQEEILDAFVARSKHLVMPATVELYLAGVDQPDDKIEKLLVLEENVIGTANKRALVSYVMATLGQPKTEAFFLDGKEPPMARLTSLARLHKRIDRSGFPDLAKRQIAERVDGLACLIERQAKLIDTALRNAPGPVEAVERLLPLAAGGALPDGVLLSGLRDRIMTLMRDPKFRPALAAAGQARIEALGQLVAKAGLEPGGPAQKASDTKGAA